MPVMPKFFAAALILLMAACTAYPLGMSEPEWLSLTPAQQLEARQAQARLDEVRRQEKAERKAHEAAKKQAEARSYQRKISRRYMKARYGDLVQCVIKTPTVDFRPGWARIDSVGFSLVKGEYKPIPLAHSQKRKETTLWGHLSEDAMNLNLCRFDPRLRRSNQCNKLVGTFNHYRRGLDYTLHLGDLIKGKITCSLAPAPGMPHYIVSETK